ncbi:MAG: sensor histidine kinase [Tannerellaceae bacterium]|jgi:signal transduction histidine kinase|nr:sensor histidine kinase [Tannerellaceae bacterium]
MKKYLILVTLLAAACTLTAQVNIDSLLNELHNGAHPAAERLRLYDRINAFYIDRDPVMAARYLDEGLVLATQEKDQSRMARYNNFRGAVAVRQVQYDTAFIYFNKSLDIARKSGIEEMSVNVYGNMAMAYSQQGNYVAALEYYMKCLAYYEAAGNNPERYMTAMANIGGMYRTAGNEDQAILYLEKARKIAEEQNFTRGKIKTWYDLGVIYMDRGESQRALDFITQVLELSRSTGETLFEVAATQVLATIYYSNTTPDVRDLNKAEQYAEEFLRLANEYGAPYYQYNAWSTLAAIYRDQKRYRESEDMALKAWAMDSTNLNESIALASTIVIANIAMGNTDRAISFFWKYNDLKNEYANTSYHQTTAEMEVKYETEKKEFRIASLEKARTLYIGLGTAITLIILLAFALLLNRHRLNLQKRRLAEQQIETLEQEKQLVATQAVLDGENAERSRLSRDLHDGLGCMLSIIKVNLKNMKSIAAMDLPDRERFAGAMDALDEAIDELRRIAHHIMPESLAREGLQASLDDFCRVVPGARFCYVGSERRLDYNMEILLYRCTYELVNNALKHAQATHIDVQLIIDRDLISLSVHDDGAGIPDTVVFAANSGLNNIRARVTAAKGKLNIYSAPGQGTEISIEIVPSPAGEG